MGEEMKVEHMLDGVASIAMNKIEELVESFEQDEDGVLEECSEILTNKLGAGVEVVFEGLSRGGVFAWWLVFAVKYRGQTILKFTQSSILDEEDIEVMLGKIKKIDGEE